MLKGIIIFQNIFHRASHRQALSCCSPIGVGCGTCQISQAIRHRLIPAALRIEVDGWVVSTWKNGFLEVSGPHAGAPHVRGNSRTGPSGNRLFPSGRVGG
jgi:hypothetical protein